MLDLDLEPRRLYQGQMLTEGEISEKRRYGRERGRAIRRGAWNPHRAPGPSVEGSEADFAWAAGFFQGEGYVRKDRAGLTVSQCEVDPLYRMQALFGGSIRLQRRKTKGWNEVWSWNCCGANARRAALLLLPWLIGKKAEQMRERMVDPS